jgi:DNA-binding HxlR family transcriptional regulator
MDSYYLEIMMKGAANHHRINALLRLKITPDMSVEELSSSCHVEYKTLSSHLKRLVTSGLITKKYYGRRVEHRLTNRGEEIVSFLRSIS